MLWRPAAASLAKAVCWLCSSMLDTSRCDLVQDSEGSSSFSPQRKMWDPLVEWKDPKILSYILNVFAIAEKRDVLNKYKISH